MTIMAGKNKYLGVFVNL